MIHVPGTTTGTVPVHSNMEEETAEEEETTTNKSIDLSTRS